MSNQRTRFRQFFPNGPGTIIERDIMFVMYLQSHQLLNDNFDIIYINNTNWSNHLISLRTNNLIDPHYLWDFENIQDINDAINRIKRKLQIIKNRSRYQYYFYNLNQQQN